MSPIKTLFFFALAIVAVFAGEQAPTKRAIPAAAYPYAPVAYPYAAAAYPYAAAAYPYAAAAYPYAAAAYPYAAYPYGHDDGSYFPGKYGPLSK